MARCCCALALILAGCVVGELPGGNGNGTGNGDGTGGGSGSGSGGGMGDGTGMTATRFLDEMGHKICDEAFTCKASFPADAGVTFDEAFGTTAAQCYTDSLAAYEPAKVEQQITAGTIIWKAGDASTCLGGITFGTCTEFWQQGPNEPAACATALVGTIADGQACVVDLECSGATSYCDPTTKKCAPDTATRTTSRFDQPLRPAVGS